MAESRSIHDADALLVFRVGPVLCCAPSLSVEAVMLPPALHKTPGSDRNHPGVFKFSSGMVSVVDLRQRFGVDESDWCVPGRMIVSEITGGHAGFHVDEVIDVMQWPQQGWGNTPAGVPREVFKRTLLLRDQIHLYADFDDLFRFRESGYLRAHIARLHEQQREIADAQQVTVMASSPPASIARPEGNAGAVVKQQDSKLARVTVTPSHTATSPPVSEQNRVRSLQPMRARQPIAWPVLSGHDEKPAVTWPEPKEIPVTEPAAMSEPVAHVSAALSDRPEKTGTLLWPVAGLAAVAVLAMLILFDSFEQTRDPREQAAAPVLSPVLSAPVGAVEESGPDYQARVEQDAEGIVITLNAPDEELIEAEPVSVDTTAKTGNLINTEPTVLPQVQAPREKVITHVVVKGDTLWDIAKRYVRNPWRYPELAKLSNIKNPHRIYPGNKVKIILVRSSETRE